MKLAPVVLSMMLMAFIMPSVVQNMLAKSDQANAGRPPASSAADALQNARLKRPAGENAAVVSPDFDDEEYAQPGQASAKRDGNGHFSFQAVMNGADVPVLVDTGATSVAINMSTAESMGIDFDEEADRVTVNTANGQTNAYRVTIEEIIIEDVVVSNVEAVVMDDEALSSTLLGMSFLSKLERFEISGDTLTLTR